MIGSVMSEIAYDLYADIGNLEAVRSRHPVRRVISAYQFGQLPVAEIQYFARLFAKQVVMVVDIDVEIHLVVARIEFRNHSFGGKTFQHVVYGPDRYGRERIVDFGGDLFCAGMPQLLQSGVHDYPLRRHFDAVGIQHFPDLLTVFSHGRFFPLRLIPQRYKFFQ